MLNFFYNNSQRKLIVSSINKQTTLKFAYFSTSIDSSVSATECNKFNSDSTAEIVRTLAQVFPPLLVYSVNGEWSIKVSSVHVPILFKFLKQHTLTSYSQLTTISAIDHFERKLRFEVVYQLISIKYNSRLTVSTSISEGFSVDSIVSTFSAAGWYERETWDMYGVFFRHHTDLRRMLTDYGFKGHPLRKDFPVTGYVEVRYNDFRKRIFYEKVSLPQEYRVFNLNFNFLLQTKVALILKTINDPKTNSYTWR